MRNRKLGSTLSIIGPEGLRLPQAFENELQEETKKGELPESLIEIIHDYDDVFSSDSKVQLEVKDSLDNQLMLLPKENMSIYEGLRRKRLIDIHTTILSGDFETFLKQLKETPELFLEELDKKTCDSIRGPSGHSASITPFRTALATGDTEMIGEIIKVIGEEKASEQFSLQFLPDFPYSVNKIRWQRSAPILAQLETLSKAIEDAKMDAKEDSMNDIVSFGSGYEQMLRVKEGSNLAKELAGFRSLLEKSLNETATTGSHFDTDLFKRALELFKNHCKNRPNDLRTKLFWQQVIGAIESIFPVNYVQALIQGLSAAAGIFLRKDFEQRQDRSLTFMVSFDGCSKVPVDFYPRAKLLIGRNLAFDVSAVASSTGLPNEVDAFIRLFSRFVASKENKYAQALLSQISYAKPCSIM